MPGISSAKLKLRQQVQLFGFLSSLLGNGFSLQAILRFYESVGNDNNFVVSRIIQRLGKGINFSDSIQPFINNDLYYQLKIAESHGKVIAALRSAENLLRAKSKYRRKIKAILAYPAFLLILLVGIIIGIKVFVTPQLEAVGTQSVHFPYLQVGLIGLLIVVTGSLIAIKIHRMGELARANLFSRLPVIGKLYRNYYAYYFANNLAFMIGSGMKIRNIIKLMLTFNHQSLVYCLAVEFKNRFNQGHSLKRMTKKYSFFPAKIIILLEAGDSREILAQKLAVYAKLCFKKMFRSSSRLIAALQPITFVIIGGIIVGTYLSMLLPMYSSLKGVYN